MLVIGPKETPYENGIFMFDIKLPPIYPAVSPIFHLTSKFCKPITYHLEQETMVAVPFLSNWTGVDKWTSNCSLLDAIVSVTSKEFTSIFSIYYYYWCLKASS